MNYGYIRVSSDKQTVENQRFEIKKFCEKHELKIDGWIEETISGTKEYSKRKLGRLLEKVKEGDLILCAELSRLGRSLFMIMEILRLLMNRGCKLWTIKDNYRLGDDIQSKVLAFAFGLSAEIERNLISQRTKEALARKRAEGVILGRPRGRKSSHVKLTKKENILREMLDAGMPKTEIAKVLKVNRMTVDAYMRNRLGIAPRQNAEGLFVYDCVCRHCGESFEAKSNVAKFCCKACQQAEWKKRTEEKRARRKAQEARKTEGEANVS